MSINRILNTATRALSAAELGIHIAGHNLANSATPGYSRQRLSLSPVAGAKTPQGQIGAGVEIMGWDRVRNPLADATYRRELSMLSEYNQRTGTLRQLESAMSELSEAGLTNAMSSFFDAWNELATNPNGTTQREFVRQRAGVLVQRYNNVAVRTDDIARQVESQARSDVQRVNLLAREVARLNGAIVSAENNGKQAPDLRDTRDRAIDEINELLQVRAIEQANGSVTLVSGSGLLVDRTAVTEIQIGLNGSDYEIQVAHSGQKLNVTGGGLGAAVGMLNTDIPDFRAEMNAVVAELVEQVNALHRAGTTLNGDTGVDFFDPAGLTASSIRLSTLVEADRVHVAAGFSAAPGDGDLAKAVDQLRHTPQAAFGGESLLDAQLSVAVRLGLSIHHAEEVVDSQSALIEDLSLQRASISGVSTEEEMVSLMQFQHAYQAAAQVVRVADEMMETLLTMVR